MDVETSKIPKSFIWVVCLLCGLPFLLNLLGVDFGTQRQVDIDPENIDTLFHKLSGAFTHTLLEWSAFCVAIFTVVLAFIHFQIKKDITTPIIGVTLFCAGMMDAFHTLAAARLIEAVADNQNLIPFTWAISRLFNALIMIAGVSIFFIRIGKNQRTKNTAFEHEERRNQKGFGFIIIVSLIFGGIAYGIIHYCATSERLPQTMYPDSLITRPWDVGPLVLFIFAGFFIYPRFHRQAPSFFSHALIISVIPEVATELHMAFGSTSLFDNHFNIAHFLKIIAYLVPLGGLLLDYTQTYHQEKKAVVQLERARKELFINNEEMSETNRELEWFKGHAMNHELRMVVLKRRINTLLKESSHPVAYDLSKIEKIEKEENQ